MYLLCYAEYVYIDWLLINACSIAIYTLLNYFVVNFNSMLLTGEVYIQIGSCGDDPDHCYIIDINITNLSSIETQEIGL